MSDAFISISDFSNRTGRSFGQGVIVSYDEDDVIRNSHGFGNFDGILEWWHVTIPDENEMIDREGLLEHMSSYAKERLFSRESINMLFHREMKEFQKGLESIVQRRAEDEGLSPNEIAQEEIKQFYDEKAGELMELVSVDGLVSFIRDRTKDNDLFIVSSFLHQIGIKGIRFNEEENQRALIFNAKESIGLETLRSMDDIEKEKERKEQKLDESLELKKD